MDEYLAKAPKGKRQRFTSGLASAIEGSDDDEGQHDAPPPGSTDGIVTAALRDEVKAKKQKASKFS